MEIYLTRKADKYLEKQIKGDPKGISKVNVFLKEVLALSQNPTQLPKCRKVENATDNRWRWRVGDYRIIGVIQKNGEIKILLILEIDKKDDNTYSHTKG